MNKPQYQWIKCTTHGVTIYNRYKFTAITYNNYIYVFSGSGDIFFRDLVRFNIPFKKWEHVISKGKTSPTKREGHSAVLYNHCVYIFGGYDSYVHYYNDLWCLDLKNLKWSEMKQIGDVPEERDGHTAVVMNGMQYIFAGFTRSTGYNNRLFMYDFDSKKWTKILPKTTPRARARHTATVYEGCMIVFGGYNGNTGTYFNDLWCFNPHTETWTELLVPNSVPGVFAHTALLYKHEMIIFGGTTRTGLQNWLWNYDLCTNRFTLLKQYNAPNSRKSHVATLYGDTMFVMGGEFDDKCRTMEVYMLPLITTYALPVVNILTKNKLIDVTVMFK